MFEKSGNNAKTALISFTILFAELLLIRLAGTEIRIFAYISNLILLAIFIGSGIGMFVKKRIPIKVSIIFLFAMILGIFTEALSVITTLLSPLTEIHIWYQETSLPVLLILLGVFLAVMVFIIVLVVFVPMGQYLGECFSSSKNVLVTYSVNIVFSLLGIWAFSLLSFKNVSPYIGLIVVIVILFGLASRKERKVGFAFFTLTIALVILNIILSKNTLWSPYQKLTL